MKALRGLSGNLGEGGRSAGIQPPSTFPTNSGSTSAKSGWDAPSQHISADLRGSFMERMIPAVSNLAVSDCDSYGYVESIVFGKFHLSVLSIN